MHSMEVKCRDRSLPINILVVFSRDSGVSGLSVVMRGLQLKVRGLIWPAEMPSYTANYETAVKPQTPTPQYHSAGQCWHTSLLPPDQPASSHPLCECILTNAFGQSNYQSIMINHLILTFLVYIIN